MRKMILMMVLVFAIMATGVDARLVMDNVHYDPAVIASGDEVDIVVRYHHEANSFSDDRINNPDYEFRVTLESDDELTEKFVTLQDTEGNQLGGAIYAGGHYNKKFRVKVNNDAPAGNYEFRLVGQWYENGEPLDSESFIRFRMPVKKEGIILDLSTIETQPAEVRPGDNYVKIVSFVENSGEKDAKSVELDLDLPEGMETSYAGDNRRWVGMVKAGQKKEITSFVDVDDKIEPGRHTLKYDFDYMDLDNNEYSKMTQIPFRIKPRPYLEVTSSDGSSLAGNSGELGITVKNTGTESAESVDVRLLKQNSQPFDFDVRSNYLGELEPGENGTVMFDIDVMRDATIREHDFKVLIRSKGDSDEGDENIYTYARRAEFDVTGEAPNPYLRMGLGAFALVMVAGIGNQIFKRKKKGAKR
ncbi:MAG: COG1361 S-layer family protein [Nanobdellota archaeon]